MGQYVSVMWPGAWPTECSQSTQATTVVRFSLASSSPRTFDSTQAHKSPSCF